MAGSGLTNTPVNQDFKSPSGLSLFLINQTEEDLFTYHITLFIAKISPVKGQLSDHMQNETKVPKFIILSFSLGLFFTSFFTLY